MTDIQLIFEETKDHMVELMTGTKPGTAGCLYDCGFQTYTS